MTRKGSIVFFLVFAASYGLIESLLFNHEFTIALFIRSLLAAILVTGLYLLIERIRKSWKAS